MSTAPSTEQDPYIDTAEVAGLTRTSPATVRWRRHVGRGPKYLVPPGTRRALYRRSDVIAWIESNEVDPSAVTRP